MNFTILFIFILLFNHSVSLTVKPSINKFQNGLLVFKKLMDPSDLSSLDETSTTKPIVKKTTPSKLVKYTKPKKKVIDLGFEGYNMFVMAGSMASQKKIGNQCVCNNDSKPVEYNYEEAIAMNEGIIITTCGVRKHILLSNKRIEANEFAPFCCSRGMQGLFLESREEVDCIYDAYYKMTPPESLPKTFDMVYSTVYSDAALLRKFVQCGDKNKPAPDIWAAEEPNNNLNMENCVGLGLMGKKETAGMMDIACLRKIFAACQEGKVLRHYTPIVVQGLSKVMKYENHYCECFECEKIAGTNYKKNAVKTDSLKGVIITSCHPTKHFFLSTDKSSVIYPNGDIFCCNLGMVRGSISSREELDCIYDEFYKNRTDRGYMKVENKFAVSNMDQTLRGDFISCPEGVRLPSDLWKSEQPNNKNQIEVCAVVDLSGSKFTIGLDDVQCYTTSRMLCQYTPPPKDIPSFENETHYETKEGKLFQHYSKPIQNLTKSLKYEKNYCETTACGRIMGKNYKYPGLKTDILKGALITNCNETKHFFLTSEKRPIYPEGEQYCCSIGMVRGSISSKEEMDCIYDEYLKISKIPKVPLGVIKQSFGTSHMDQTLRGDFISCPERERLPSELWNSEQPDNKNKSESCSVFEFTKTKNTDIFGFDDVQCSEKTGLICQYDVNLRNDKNYTKIEEQKISKVTTTSLTTSTQSRSATTQKSIASLLSFKKL